MIHIHQIRVRPSWMDFIVLFLKEDILLEGKSEANKVRRKAHWLDIIGPFLKAVGNKRWLLVGKDYFTKLVEVEPLANIKDMDVRRFV